jgi:hypothetical protein
LGTDHGPHPRGDLHHSLKLQNAKDIVGELRDTNNRLAVHMGAANIGLIGIDFTDNHFFGPAGPYNWVPFIATIDAQFGRLCRARWRAGIQRQRKKPAGSRAEDEDRYLWRARCHPDEDGSPSHTGQSAGSSTTGMRRSIRPVD